jgi:hypothetical protein
MARDYSTPSGSKIHEILIGEDLLFPVDLDARDYQDELGLRNVADRLTRLGQALLTCLRFTQQRIEPTDSDEHPRTRVVLSDALEGIEFIGEIARAIRAEAENPKYQSSTGGRA